MMAILLRECVQLIFLSKLKTAYMKCSFFPSHGNRAGSVNYELTTSNGKAVTIDQRRKSDGENLWHSLGSFQFTANQIIR